MTSILQYPQTTFCTNVLEMSKYNHKHFIILPVHSVQQSPVQSIESCEVLLSQLFLHLWNIWEISTGHMLLLLYLMTPNIDNIKVSVETDEKIGIHRLKIFD